MRHLCAIILTHFVGVKLTHLGEDGGFLAAADVDSGASSGNQGFDTKGLGIRAIARELGCSRNTVRRYLRDEAAARYGPRQPRPTKLDPHKAYLLERIDAARPRWIPAVVLLREIRERGYAGGLTQLKAFINPLKQARPIRWCASRPRPASRCRPTSPSFGAGAIRCSLLWRRWATAGRAGCALRRPRMR